MSVHVTSLDESIKAAELRKLQLEIERLEQKPPWTDVAHQFLPLLTALVAVAGFIWGIREFASEQEAQQRQVALDLQKHNDELNERRDALQRQMALDLQRHADGLTQQIAERESKLAQEFQHRFWEERLQVYRDVTRITGTLASSQDPETFHAKEGEFWTLYWGEMSVIEDRGVLQAMKAFGDELLRSRPMPSEDARAGATANFDLKSRAYDLARACRGSLNATWEVIKLDDLPVAAQGFQK